jgi:hypothetical protein
VLKMILVSKRSLVFPVEEFRNELNTKELSELFSHLNRFLSPLDNILIAVVAQAQLSRETCVHTKNNPRPVDHSHLQLKITLCLK